MSESERKDIAEEESLFMPCLPGTCPDGVGGHRWHGVDEPSSVHYCRPLRIQYAKESKELVVAEYNSFKDADLAPTISEAGLLIKHSLEVSMIDGKVSCI